MTHAVWPRIVEQAGFLLTRFEVGRDGKTAYEQLKGIIRRSGPGLSFEEEIMWKRRRAGGPLGKLTCMWEDGVCLGIKATSNPRRRQWIQPGWTTRGRQMVNMLKTQNAPLLPVLLIIKQRRSARWHSSQFSHDVKYGDGLSFFPSFLCQIRESRIQLVLLCLALGGLNRCPSHQRRRVSFNFANSIPNYLTRTATKTKDRAPNKPCLHKTKLHATNLDRGKQAEDSRRRGREMLRKPVKYLKMLQRAESIKDSEERQDEMR